VSAARPARRALRRSAVLVIAVVGGVVAAAGLLAGLAAAGTPPEPPYVSLGLASGTADADGTVALHLYARNSTGDPVDGTLAVRLAEGAAPGADLWTGTIRADPGATGIIDVTLPGVCGRRLSASLVAPGAERSLLLLIPCQAASGEAP
jgi:hypothetical protein